jgi:hypothetical protein
MPTGPKGEKRPADVIGAAIRVARIAVGEEEDPPAPTPDRAEPPKKRSPAKEAGRLALLL